MNRNDTNLTIGIVLSKTAAALNNTSPTPDLEAEILLGYVCSKSKEELHAHPEAFISEANYDKVQKLLAERITGKPVAYLVGFREFYGLNLKVNTSTLIPRPETELLVELALGFINASNTKPVKILEIGTGSGAISIAIAKNASYPVAIQAIDISKEALEVAKINAKSHNAANIAFIQSDLREYTLKHNYDLVIANLPYIPSEELPTLPKEVKFEPVGALDGGKDGLDYFRYIPKYLDYLNPTGICLLEIHSTLHPNYEKLWPQGWNQSLFKDLSGKPRVIKLNRARR